MPYTDPTIEDFRNKFPEFDEDGYQPDNLIQDVLDAAKRQVDNTWTEGDYQDAILFLAAHFMTVTTFAADSVGQENIKSLSIGPLSIAYGEQVSANKLESSPYGQRFKELRKVNVITHVVV